MKYVVSPGHSAATINMYLNTHLLRNALLTLDQYTLQFWVLQWASWILSYQSMLHWNSSYEKVSTILWNQAHDILRSIHININLFRSFLNKSPGGTATDTLFPCMSDYISEYIQVHIMTLVNWLSLQPFMNYLLQQNASFLPPFSRSSFDNDSLHYLWEGYSTFYKILSHLTFLLCMTVTPLLLVGVIELVVKSPSKKDANI